MVIFVEEEISISVCATGLFDAEAVKTEISAEPME